ncbi:MAG: cell division protein ZapA [Gammaproteobacteria bacterium]|nr:cell division protein ZapA [Gammaproteobacteria bacterium]
MNGTSVETTIEILGKLYQIKCPENEVETLKQAAHWLNEKMRAFRSTSGIVQPELVALMTALNIARDFLQLEQHNNHERQTIQERLHHLDNQIKHALLPDNQLELQTAE